MFIGALIGYAIYRWKGDALAIPVAMVAAILPDLVDKPLTYTVAGHLQWAHIRTRPAVPGGGAASPLWSGGTARRRPGRWSGVASGPGRHVGRSDHAVLAIARTVRRGPLSDTSKRRHHRADRTVGIRLPPGIVIIAARYGATARSQAEGGACAHTKSTCDLPCYDRRDGQVVIAAIALLDVGGPERGGPGRGPVIGSMLLPRLIGEWRKVRAGE